MEKSLLIFCDGGALNNPGPAASAFVVVENQKIIHQFSQKIGHNTNNVAEYQAVIFALEWLKKNIPLRQGFEGQVINFFLDSQLVVNQLNGLYKVKDAKLKLLIIKIKGLEQEIVGKIFYKHIPREQNTIADALVKSVLSR